MIVDWTVGNNSIKKGARARQLLAARPILHETSDRCCARARESQWISPSASGITTTSALSLRTSSSGEQRAHAVRRSMARGADRPISSLDRSRDACLISYKVRYNSSYEPLQGLRIQKSEHEMGHAHFMKLLQFPDHFCAVSSHEVLLRMAYNLIGVL